MASTSGLRLVAARAEMIPAITKYMSALDVAVLASSTGHDVEGAQKNFTARKYELQTRLADTDVIADVRSGVNTLLNGGQALLDKVLADSIGLRDRVTAYAPLLLTAQNVIDASVRVDSEQIRTQVQGLSRAVGARGQMTMQEILVTRGADLAEPQLRSAMVTLAGTEPSTLFGMSAALGAGSPDTKNLQQQMVTRMAIMSDPAVALVNNPELLHSIQITRDIAEQVITDTTEAVTKSVQSQATDRRDAAIRDAVLVLAAIATAIVVVLVVARTLVGPMRVLRDGALKVAHTDLDGEIAAVRAGDEPIPEPLAVYTTEEIGQVAHAVDELHTRACCWPARKRGCDCWSTRCLRPCRGVAVPWSTSSCRSSTNWSATRRIPPDSTAFSGSITWPPGCAATAPTCWCWPVRRLPVTTASRCRCQP